MAGQLVNAHISDEELRVMRCLVYPATGPASSQTEASWENVKHNWRKDAEWLMAEVMKLRTMRWDSRMDNW